MAGMPSISPSHRFTDVRAGQFFATPVAWAQANGIVEGYSVTSFGPNNHITREQLAAILHRYIRHIGGNATAPAGIIDRYSDAGLVSSWARASMNWAAHHGIMGLGTSNLDPKGNALRSHAVATLHRVVNTFNIRALNLPPLSEIPGAPTPSTPPSNPDQIPYLPAYKVLESNSRFVRIEYERAPGTSNSEYIKFLFQAINDVNAKNGWRIIPENTPHFFSPTGYGWAFNVYNSLGMEMAICNECGARDINTNVHFKENAPFCGSYYGTCGFIPCGCRGCWK